MDFYVFSAFGFCAMWGALGLHQGVDDLPKIPATLRILLRLVLIGGLAATMPVLETGRMQLARAAVVIAALAVGGLCLLHRAINVECRRLGIAPGWVLASAVIVVFLAVAYPTP
jgi:hypothetical protein